MSVDVVPHIALPPASSASGAASPPIGGVPPSSPGELPSGPLPVKPPPPLVPQALARSSPAAKEIPRTKRGLLILGSVASVGQAAVSMSLRHAFFANSVRKAASSFTHSTDTALYIDTRIPPTLRC